MIVDFTKNADKLFNQSFFDIRKAKTRFVVVYGGSGSGKSVSVHQSEIINLLAADNNTLVIRKHASDLYDSCYALFQEQAARFNIYDLFTWNYSQMKRQILCNDSGKKIILRGLDDPEKVKSIVGIKRIVIEEANQLEFKDFREINRRARGMPGIQIIMMLNPVDEEHWIKKQFVDPPNPNEKTGAYSPDTTVLKYNYGANKFLTQEDIDELERLKLIDENEYNIYVLGLWGIRDNKRSWLYNFKRETHVVPKMEFLPTFPVYLSFDFNNEPFACVATQMSPQMGLPTSFIRHYCEFSGYWKIEEMCQRIRATFPASILYITGDRSGQNQDLGRNQTLYQMIASYLGVNDRLMNLNTHNIEHSDSRLLCNSLLARYPSITFNEKLCPNLINQCSRARVDDKAKQPSKLLKDREDHKNDELDAMRYFYQTYMLEFAQKTYFRLIKN